MIDISRFSKQSINKLSRNSQMSYVETILINLFLMSVKKSTQLYTL